MDLPDLTSHAVNEEKLSLTKTNDLVSSESVDTGFVSDSTYDSPTSESGKDLIESVAGDKSVIKDTATADEDDKSVAEVTASTDEDSKPVAEATASTDEDKAEEDKPQIEEKTPEDDYVDILGNGLLRRKVLVPGNGVDSRPNNGDTVTLRISGKLDDGTQVENGEISFTLNDGDVIVALDLGVALMEMGEKCELFTSPRYAYGELGREPDIPKNADISFVLELIDIQPQVAVSSLAFQERLQQGESKRLRGNFLFGRADYSGAINSYSKAVKVLDDTDLNAGLDESDRAQLEDVWTKCYNNMAACQLKIDALDAAVRSAEKVLTSQPDNVKALFRMGKAYGGKGEVDKAISYLKKALLLDPESKMLHQEMFVLTKRKNKETASERDLYRKMLGVKTEDSPAPVKQEKANSNSLLRWGLTLGGVAAVVASVGVAWYRNS